MHPQHFGTDPIDTRIRIDPKIRIRIPHYFRLKFWRRRRFTLSECSCIHYCHYLCYSCFYGSSRYSLHGSLCPILLKCTLPSTSTDKSRQQSLQPVRSICQQLDEVDRRQPPPLSEFPLIQQTHATVQSADSQQHGEVLIGGHLPPRHMFIITVLVR